MASENYYQIRNERTQREWGLTYNELRRLKEQAGIKGSGPSVNEQIRKFRPLFRETKNHPGRYKQVIEDVRKIEKKRGEALKAEVDKLSKKYKIRKGTIYGIVYQGKLKGK